MPQAQTHDTRDDAVLEITKKALFPLDDPVDMTTNRLYETWWVRQLYYTYAFYF